MDLAKKMRRAWMRCGSSESRAGQSTGEKGGCAADETRGGIHAASSDAVAEINLIFAAIWKLI